MLSQHVSFYNFTEFDPEMPQHADIPREWIEEFVEIIILCFLGSVLKKDVVFRNSVYFDTPNHSITTSTRVSVTKAAIFWRNTKFYLPPEDDRLVIGTRTGLVAYGLVCGNKRESVHLQELVRWGVVLCVEYTDVIMENWMWKWMFEIFCALFNNIIIWSVYCDKQKLIIFLKFSTSFSKGLLQCPNEL